MQSPRVLIELLSFIPEVENDLVLSIFRLVKSAKVHFNECDVSFGRKLYLFGSCL